MIIASDILIYFFWSCVLVIWIFWGIVNLQVTLGPIYANNWSFTEFSFLSIRETFIPLLLPNITQRFLESPLGGRSLSCQTWVHKQSSHIFPFWSMAAFHAGERLAWACCTLRGHHWNCICTLQCSWVTCEVHHNQRVLFLRPFADLDMFALRSIPCPSSAEPLGCFSSEIGGWEEGKSKDNFLLSSLPQALPPPWPQLRLDKPTMDTVSLEWPSPWVAVLLPPTLS